MSTVKLKQIRSKLRRSINTLAKDYYQLGVVLRDLRAYCGSVSEFRAELEVAGLKYRRAMHLIDAADTIEQFGLDPTTYLTVGWKKMAILYPYLDGKNYKKWIAYASNTTVAGLQSKLSGGPSKTIQLAFSLTQAEYKEACAVLKKYGAVREGRHGSTRNRAFMKMVRKAGK